MLVEPQPRELGVASVLSTFGRRQTRIKRMQHRDQAPARSSHRTCPEIEARRRPSPESRGDQPDLAGATLDLVAGPSGSASSGAILAAETMT